MIVSVTEPSYGSAKQYWSFALAVALPLATLWVRQAFIAPAPDYPAFVIFVVPVVVTAYVGGLTPGALATIISAFCIDYYLLAPTGSLAIKRGFDVVNLLTFTGAGFAMSVASEHLHRTRRLAAALAQVVEHDSLTGLPNRSVLIARLKHAIARAERNGGLGAVLFLDLDGFKAVNDTLGHAAGDELLVAVAACLRDKLRAIDTVARVGGDEFVVLLEDLAEPQKAAVVARSLIARLGQSAASCDGRVSVGASIGISLFPSEACDAEGAMRHADVALYRAKAAGRGTYRFYDQVSAQSET